MLDREQTRRANKVLQSDPDDTEGYNTFVRNAGQSIEVPFGSACCFWTGLIHVIPINTESETRWSLNTRFKNAFSPYGAKGLPDYFRILDLSPVAKLGVEAEKERYADLPRPKVALS